MKKYRVLTLLGLMALSAATIAQAQDYDDIYYDASKSVTATTKTKVVKPAKTVAVYGEVPEKYKATVQDNYRVERDVDEYNRRGNYEPDYAVTIDGDTLYDDEAFANTRRIERFYNPDVVILSDDDELVELYYDESPTINLIVGSSWPTYSYGWSSSYYDPWFYDSFYPWYTGWSPYYRWSHRWAWDYYWGWPSTAWVYNYYSPWYWNHWSWNYHYWGYTHHHWNDWGHHPYNWNKPYSHRDRPSIDRNGHNNWNSNGRRAGLATNRNGRGRVDAQGSNRNSVAPSGSRGSRTSGVTSSGNRNRGGYASSRGGSGSSRSGGSYSGGSRNSGSRSGGSYSGGSRSSGSYSGGSRSSGGSYSGGSRSSGGSSGGGRSGGGGGGSHGGSSGGGGHRR